MNPDKGIGLLLSKKAPIASSVATNYIEMKNVKSFKKYMYISKWKKKGEKLN